MSYFARVGMLNTDREQLTKEQKTELFEAKVRHEYNVSKEELHSKCRKRYIIEPRQIMMYVMRVHYGYRLERIASYFDKNHSTVIHAVKNIKNIMFSDKHFEQKLNVLINK